MPINFSQGGVTVSPKMKPGIHKVYVLDANFGPRKENDPKQYLTLELRNEANQHHLVSFSCSSVNDNYQERLLSELQYLLQSFVDTEQMVKLFTNKEVGKFYDEKDYASMWSVITKQLQGILEAKPAHDRLFAIKLQGMVNEYNGKVTEFAGWEFPAFADSRTKKFVVTNPFIAKLSDIATLQYDPSKDMTIEKHLAMKASATPAPKPASNVVDDNNPFASY